LSIDWEVQVVNVAVLAKDLVEVVFVDVFGQALDDNLSRVSWLADRPHHNHPASRALPDSPWWTWPRGSGCATCCASGCSCDRARDCGFCCAGCDCESEYGCGCGSGCGSRCGRGCGCGIWRRHCGRRSGGGPSRAIACARGAGRRRDASGRRPPWENPSRQKSSTSSALDAQRSLSRCRVALSPDADSLQQTRRAKRRIRRRWSQIWVWFGVKLARQRLSADGLGLLLPHTEVAARQACNWLLLSGCVPHLPTLPQLTDTRDKLPLLEFLSSAGKEGTKSFEEIFHSPPATELISQLFMNFIERVQRAASNRPGLVTTATICGWLGPFYLLTPEN